MELVTDADTASEELLKRGFSAFFRGYPSWARKASAVAFPNRHSG
jgi:hypothetical protein